jgi:hypothetical protein
MSTKPRLLRADDAIAERIAVIQAWWREYDALHRAQQVGGESLRGLVPGEWAPAHEESGPLHRHLLSPGLVNSIDVLWGRAIARRGPAVLVSDLESFTRFAKLLQPAVRLWDDLALTCWYTCVGPYSRRSLGELADYQRDLRRILAAAGAPIDESIYAEFERIRLPRRGQPGAKHTTSMHLDERTGEVTVQHTYTPPRLGPTAEQARAFTALRAIVDRYRGRWVNERLGALLESRWRSCLTAAADGYWKRVRDRGGKPPTVKQALADVGEPALLWFGGDYGLLARTLGLTGPITVSPDAFDASSLSP